MKALHTYTTNARQPAKKQNARSCTDDTLDVKSENKKKEYAGSCSLVAYHEDMMTLTSWLECVINADGYPRP